MKSPTNRSPIHCPYCTSTSIEHLDQQWHHDDSYTITFACTGRDERHPEHFGYTAIFELLGTT